MRSGIEIEIVKRNGKRTIQRGKKSGKAQVTVRRKAFRVPAKVKAWLWAGSFVAAFMLGMWLTR